MTKETMTVHKLLAELKTLDKRIEDKINSSTYCTFNEHSNGKLNGLTIPQFMEQMKGDYASVTDLIKRRKALRRALMLSNVQTHVTIMDTDYTVAEAIEMRNHGIELEDQLMNVMVKQYTKSTDCIAKFNESVVEKAEDYVIKLFTGQDGKIRTEDAEATRKQYIELHSYDLIDPLNVHEKIGELHDYINGFMSEVDAALSTSNALTTVEIEY